MPRIAPLLLALLSLLPAAGPAGAVVFEPAAGLAGLDFLHAATDLQDEFGEHVPINYPETNGGGACWGDVDGDGVDDLFLVNGRYSNATLQAVFDPRSALFLNDGDGTFTAAGRAWGVDVSAWGQGCSFADYDGDADPDLLLIGYDTLFLYRNEGERFANATAASNLSLAGKCGAVRCFAESGAWADYDGDGDLDVYVATMVAYDVDANASEPVSPSRFPGQPDLLFRNRGDGTFEDATAEAGVDDDPGPNHSKSFQAEWADFDRDGDPDIYVASDTTPNTLFLNHGNGTFTDVAAARGVDDPRSSMGLVFNDVTGDGRPDLYMTHYVGENNGFYEGLAGGGFEDRSGEGELGDDFLYLGWGAGFHDFDHDGRGDVYAVNGHTTPYLFDMNMTHLLFLQRADGTFDNVSAGPAFDDPFAARGSAAADYDLDGDLDLAVVAMYNQTARLFRHAGAAPHWLQVELRQGGMNRFAIGAEVTVRPDGGAPAATRTLQAGNSFLSQDSLVVHAGLGNATGASVEVRWPWGGVETWTGIAADQRVRLTRGDPAVQRDTLAPRTAAVLDGPGQGGWFRGPVTVSAAAVDRAMGPPSGVARTEIREAGTWAPYAGPFTVEGEGLRAFALRSADAAGNQEPPRTTVVRIDATPPRTTAAVQGVPGDFGWYPHGAAVRFEAADALSGVARVWSRVGDGAWEEGLARYIAGPGEHVVAYHAEDVAGNVEAPRSMTVRIDAQPPQVAVRGGPVLLAVGPARVEADATDAGSGVARVAFFLDDEAAPRFVDRDGADGWGWDFPGGPGLHRVRVLAVDGAGLAAADAAVLAALPPVPPLGLLLLSGVPLAARRKPA